MATEQVASEFPPLLVSRNLNSNNQIYEEDEEEKEEEDQDDQNQHSNWLLNNE